MIDQVQVSRSSIGRFNQKNFPFVEQDLEEKSNSCEDPKEQECYKRVIGSAKVKLPCSRIESTRFVFEEINRGCEIFDRFSSIGQSKSVRVSAKSMRLLPLLLAGSHGSS